MKKARKPSKKIQKHTRIVTKCSRNILSELSDKLICVNYSQANTKTIIFIGGYVAGSTDINDLNDTHWMYHFINYINLKTHNVFVLNWDSRTLKEITQDYILYTQTLLEEKQNFMNILKKSLFFYMKNASFPKAYVNSIITGEKLAKLLIKSKMMGITLVGHSLGGKIVIECMNNLYKLGYSTEGNHKPFISNIIVLGASSYINEEKIRNVSKATLYKCINAYNTNDKILMYGLGIISRMLLLKLNVNPYNIVGIKKVDYFTNIDCTKHISKTHFGHNYSNVIKWLVNHKEIYNLLF